MNPELRSLISLQELDLKIMELERKNSDIPHQLAYINDQLKKHEEQLNAAKQKALELLKQRRKMEGDVEILRSKLSKYKDQLMEVKTNKEYAAVLKEIEVAKKEIDQSEDKVLELMETIEQIETDLKHQENGLRVEREKASIQQKELGKVGEGLKNEIEQVNQLRSTTLNAISPALVEKYHHIASQRKGIALAEAREETCQVCYVRLRPQVFSDVKRNDQIITCESCDRILFWNGIIK